MAPSRCATNPCPPVLAATASMADKLSPWVTSVTSSIGSSTQNANAVSSTITAAAVLVPGGIFLLMNRATTTTPASAIMEPPNQAITWPTPLPAGQ